jgi:hypothetical protein
VQWWQLSDPLDVCSVTIFSEGCWEKPRKTPVKLSDVPTEIPTEKLPNTNLESCHHSNLPVDVMQSGRKLPKYRRNLLNPAYGYQTSQRHVLRNSNLQRKNRYESIVADLLKALLGNGSVNTFQHTRHATVEMFSM